MKFFSVNNPQLDNIKLTTPIITSLVFIAFLAVNIHTLSVRNELWVLIFCVISSIIFIMFLILNGLTIYSVLKRRSMIKQKK